MVYRVIVGIRMIYLVTVGVKMVYLVHVIAGVRMVYFVIMGEDGAPCSSLGVRMAHLLAACRKYCVFSGGDNNGELSVPVSCLRVRMVYL
jgi:hypothetical protein